MPPREGGEHDGEAAFDDHEPLPAGHVRIVDLEDSEGDEAAKCTGDGGAAVENCHAECDFIALVEEREVECDTLGI